VAGRTDAIPQIEVEPQTAASGARFENRFSVKSDVESIEKVAIASLKGIGSQIVIEYWVTNSQVLATFIRMFRLA